MAAGKISSARRRKPPGFMNLLSSAACEWFLIFLLFVDAALSYLLTKFAEYCELKPPCLLCSRLDHLFGENKPGGYWGALCSSHREELSSLVPCPVHGKLAEANRMCEECFMPIATQNRSPSESYKLLIGKLWVDADQSVLQNLMLNKQVHFGFSGSRICSCCNKPWRAKSNAERLLALTPVGYGASKAHVKPPLPRAPGRSRFSRRDSLKRLRDKFTGPVSQLSCLSSSSGADTLSHVGYSKLKISSDTESEFQFSEDDDDGTVVSHGKTESMPELGAFDMFSEKQTPLNLDLPNLLDLSDNRSVHSSSSTVDAFIEHGLRELNWTESCQKQTQLPAGLASSGDDPQRVDAEMGSSRESAETSEPNDEAVEEIKPIQAETVTSSDDTSFSDAESISRSDSLEKTTDKEVRTSPRKSSSPRVLDEQGEFKTQKDSNSQSITTSEEAERNDSSHDVASDCDNEGENVLDRLKRQVENDQSCMNSLYKELEEERNAAAVAANEAMAMITRLQEEKASMHMEALQYLRMMEEQAQYDMEALQRANDLVSEKDKELQDLEAELEIYRNDLVDAPATPRSVNSPRTSRDSKSSIFAQGNGICKPDADKLASSFEDEKLYISQCLKSLEKKMEQACRGRHVEDTQNGLNSENAKNGPCMEKEVAELQERVEALESDGDFLKHVSNLFRNGKDGFNLIQDIAHQLKELRKVEFDKR